MKHLLINPEMKLADVVHENYMLIPTLDRFGIKLGFGDKTIHDICMEKNININFLIELLNAFHHEDYIPSPYIKTIDIKSLIQYLKNTHKSYLEDWIVTIQNLIEGLSELEEDGVHTQLILKFFNEYKHELKEHISREENIVFPYINTLNNIVTKQQVSEAESQILKDYSMKKFEKEHDDISIKLKDLKNIMIKYIVSPNHSLRYYSIIQELFKLEEDILYHTRIEDKILIPRVAYLEQEVKNLL